MAYKKFLKSQSHIIVRKKASEYKEDVAWVWQWMPETQAELGRSEMSLRLAWSTYWIWGEPGLYSKTAKKNQHYHHLWNLGILCIILCFPRMKLFWNKILWTFNLEKNEIDRYILTKEATLLPSYKASFSNIIVCSHFCNDDV